MQNDMHHILLCFTESTNTQNKNPQKGKETQMTVWWEREKGKNRTSIGKKNMCLKNKLKGHGGEMTVFALFRMETRDYAGGSILFLFFRRQGALECTYFSGIDRRFFMFLICWKWYDMSVASTISITRPRNSLQGPNNKRCIFEMRVCPQRLTETNSGSLWGQEFFDWNDDVFQKKMAAERANWGGFTHWSWRLPVFFGFTPCLKSRSAPGCTGQWSRDCVQVWLSWLQVRLRCSIYPGAPGRKAMWLASVLWIPVSKPCLSMHTSSCFLRSLFRQQTYVHILSCLLQPVWTLPFTAMCSERCLHSFVKFEVFCNLCEWCRRSLTFFRLHTEQFWPSIKVEQTEHYLGNYYCEAIMADFASIFSPWNSCLWGNGWCTFFCSTCRF